LLHAVLPTRLPRAEFYELMARFYVETESSVAWALRTFIRARPAFVARIWPSMLWFFARTWRYQRVHYDYRSFLRDEEGLLTGPGARAGLTHEDVRYPKSDGAMPNESESPALEPGAGAAACEKGPALER
jgi:hypothetical protein